MGAAAGQPGQYGGSAGEQEKQRFDGTLDLGAGTGRPGRVGGQESVTVKSSACPERPTHCPHPRRAGGGGVCRHRSGDTEGDGDVLAVDQDVEAEIGDAGDRREAARIGLNPQLRDDVRGRTDSAELSFGQFRITWMTP